MVSVYLDTSVLVAMFTQDAHTPRADGLLARKPVLYISDFAAAEFASAIARRVRTAELSKDAALSVFSNFDLWRSDKLTQIETTASDIRSAELYLRRLDLTLRTPDALHLAIAQRANIPVATFDDAMSQAAEQLNIALLA